MQARDPASDPRVQEHVGRVIGGYPVVKWIGSGGTGDVYEAREPGSEPGSGRRVALKMLGPEFRDRPDRVERFMREAASAQRVQHPNVVEILACSEADAEFPFLVMELLEGPTLREIMDREGPMPWSRVHPIATQILAALTAAHGSGLVHRDLKPDNVVLEGERVKVLDFGIAKVIGDELSSGTLSRTGTVVGTAHYMSPEQVNSEDLDARADLYALGVILFEMLTGKVPFDAPGFMGILVRHVEAPIPVMAEHAPGVAVPAPVEAMVRKAMAKAREDRWADADAMAAALPAAEVSEPASREGSVPRWMLGAAVLVIAVVVVALALS